MPILAVAVVAIAAVVIFSATRCSSGGGGRSAQDLANEISAAYQRVFDENMSDGSVEAYSETLLNVMPPEFVDAAIEESGVDGRGEALEQLGDGLVASLSSADAMLEKADIDIQVTVGDKLDDDYVDGLNEDFENLGLDFEATEAYELGADMTITAREDVGALEAGESTSQEMSNVGMTAVKIGNAWYLWVNGISW